MATNPDIIELKKHPARFDPNTIHSSYSSYEHLANLVRPDQLDGGADGGVESKQLPGEPGPHPLTARISSTLSPEDRSLHSRSTEVTSMIPASFDGAQDEICSLDGLIADLDSDDEGSDSEKVSVKEGEVHAVNEDLLRTDLLLGLDDEEVAKRRRKFGFNRLSEEKNNHLKKLLGFFVGPIQFVMEVGSALDVRLHD